MRLFRDVVLGLTLVAGGALAEGGDGAMLDGEAAFIAARRPVSLKETLSLAAKNSQDLKAAQAQAAQVAARAGLVYSALLPELKLQATYVLTSAEQKFEGSKFIDAMAGVIDASIRGAAPAYPFGYLPSGLPMQPNEQVLDSVKSGFTTEASKSLADTTIVARSSVYGSLVLSQVLFAPQFFLLPAASESVEAARLGGLEAKEQVLLAVARVYLGLEGLAQLERAARDAEQVALKRERDAKTQATIGTNTEINVLRAQTETAQARATLATLAGQRLALLALLEALVGEGVRPLDGAPTKIEITAADEGASPWDDTNLVKSTTWGLRAQERFNLFDRLAWLPTVVVQGKGSYNSNKGFANTNFIFDGIIAAEWALYDRGVRSANLHENDAKTAQLKAQLDGARAKGRAAWIGAKTNLAAAQVALAQAEAQAQLAARAQKQVEAAYELGMSTSLELSDIDSRRFFAASAAAHSRAQLEVRKVELAAAEGRLVKVVGLEP